MLDGCNVIYKERGVHRQSYLEYLPTQTHITARIYCSGYKSHLYQLRILRSLVVAGTTIRNCGKYVVGKRTPQKRRKLIEEDRISEDAIWLHSTELAALCTLFCHVF